MSSVESFGPMPLTSSCAATGHQTPGGLSAETLTPAASRFGTITSGMLLIISSAPATMLSSISGLFSSISSSRRRPSAALSGGSPVLLSPTVNVTEESLSATVTDWALKAPSPVMGSLTLARGGNLLYVTAAMDTPLYRIGNGTL